MLSSPFCISTIIKDRAIACHSVPVKYALNEIRWYIRILYTICNKTIYNYRFIFKIGKP